MHVNQYDNVSPMRNDCILSISRKSLMGSKALLVQELGRKTCAGCDSSFGPRYYRTHMEENFDNKRNTYLCAKVCLPETASSDSEISLSSDEQCNAMNIEQGDAPDSASGEDDIAVEGGQWHQRAELVKESYNVEHEDIDAFFNVDNDASTSSGEESGDDEQEVLQDEEAEQILRDFPQDDNEDIIIERQPRETMEVSFVRWFCIFIMIWQMRFVISDSAVAALLSFLSVLFLAFTNVDKFFQAVYDKFPRTIKSLWDLNKMQRGAFSKFIVCPKCYSLYKVNDCYYINRGEKHAKQCTFVEFPNHRQRHRRAPCGVDLVKVSRTVTGKQIIIPFKSYCYKSLKESFDILLKRPGFQNQCNQWRTREIPGDVLEDIYDGAIWKDFADRFLNDSQKNFAFMLNLDWFNPFKHAKYSIGGIYLVCLNLPRSERFKRKNVILVGIIPAMKHEPPTNTFLKPLVQEFIEGWEDGYYLTSHESPDKAEQYRFALLCVGCDIPACRKLCGFLGHSATRGCSRCNKTFPGRIGEKLYSGFDRATWEPRNHNDHLRKVDEVMKCQTKTDRQRLQSEHGARYSELFKLPYYDCIRMAIIDPMHNLFLGTAKHTLNVWKELGILTDEKLQLLDQKLTNIRAAADVGKLPTKLVSAYSSFTADEFKNWTILFSVYGFKDIVADQHLECWRKFVLACRILCSKVITQTDIRMADMLFVEFCRTFERLYGEERVTPNMHLHGHICECVSDFGPIYSFWLFSFERYNGILGGLPSNKRDIETQFFSRFLREVQCLDSQIPDNFQDEFSQEFAGLLDPKDRGSLAQIPLKCLYPVMRLSSRRSNYAVEDWTDLQYITMKPLPKALAMDRLDLQYLESMYKALYPQAATIAAHVSYRKANFIYIGKEVFGSCSSRTRRSSTVLAYWHSTGGDIMPFERMYLRPRPGVVEEYLMHVATIDGNPHVHIIARIKWHAPINNKDYYGNPVEVWSSELYDDSGPSKFMPVQRIKSKFVKLALRKWGRNVLVVFPRDYGLNI